MPSSNYSDERAGSIAFSVNSGRSSAPSAWSSQLSDSTGQGLTHSTSNISTGSSRSRLSSTNTSQGSAFRESRLKKQLQHGGWLRRHCFDIVNHTLFSSAILFIIMLNTVVLAIQTTAYLSLNYGWYITVLDQIFLGIYLMETSMKFYVYRLQYFFSGWNVFDLIIVFTSLLSFLLPSIMSSTVDFNPQVIRLFRVFRAFRAIRSLRTLRAVAFLKSLQVIVQTLLQSIPAISSIVALAVLVLYIFAVIGRSLYATVDPRRFGSLASTGFRLFTCLTLDDWTDIWHENKRQSPEIFFYLFVFIILESFVFLNLLVAVICTNLEQSRTRMEQLRKKDHKQQKRLMADQNQSGATPVASLDAFEEQGEGGNREMLDLFENDLGLDNYYSPNLPHRQKELMCTYLMLLTSLEHNYGFYQKQQKVLDDLVDLVKTSAQAQEGG